MSNQKPHLYYLIFDWETGGLTSNDCAVVELVMIALRADNFEEIGRVDNIIVPYDKNGITCNYDFDSHMILDVSKKLPKENQDLIKDINNDIKSIYDFTYSEGSYKVHGIGSKEMMSDGVEIVDVVKAVIKLANSAKVSNFSKAVLVGHNPDFDRNFLQQVFEVTGNMKSMEKIFHGSKDHYGNFQPHMIDTIDLAKLKWHKNEEEISGYSLEVCANKAGIDLVGAHRAINDVITTKDLLLYFKNCIRSDVKKEDSFRFREKFEF